MKIVESNVFLEITITPDDYKSGKADEIKEVIKDIPEAYYSRGSYVIKKRYSYLLDPFLYGPFSEAEIIVGEKELRDFLDQFDYTI
jgi:hypothetical protein